MDKERVSNSDFRSDLGKRLGRYLEYAKTVKNFYDKNMIKFEYKIIDKSADDQVKILLKTIPDPSILDVYDLSNIDFMYEYQEGEKYWEMERIGFKGSIEDGKITLERHPMTRQLLVPPLGASLYYQINAIEELYDIFPASSPLLDIFRNRKDVTWKDVETVDIKNWYFLKDQGNDINSDSADSGLKKQRKFVEIAMGTPDFAFLEGPPGSGKTTVLCELVQQMVLQNKRIIVCASTNIAVDNLIERLADKKINPSGKNLIVMKSGNPKNPEKRITPWIEKNAISTKRMELLDYLCKKENGRASEIFKTMLEREKQHAESMINESEYDGGIVGEIMRDCGNVICGTVAGINKYFKNLKNIKFDMMILDEASKTTFQEFLIPALRAQRWIIVGDTKQLAPYTDEFEVLKNIEGKIRNEHADLCLDAFMAKRKDRGPRQGPKNRNLKGGKKFSGSALRVILIDKDNQRTKYDYESQCRKNGTLLQNIDVDQSIGQSGIAIGTVESLSWINPPTQNLIIRNFDKMAKMYKKLVRSDKKNKAMRAKNLKRWYNMAQNFSESMNQTTWSKQICWRVRRHYECSSNSQYENLANLYMKEIRELIPSEEIDGVDAKKIMKNIEAVRMIAFPSILELMQHGFRHSTLEEDTVIGKGMGGKHFEQRHVLLSEQYRMHPDIANFARKYVYDNKALNTPKEIEQNLNWDYDKYPSRLYWLHVAGNFDDNSNKNEAERIVGELRQFQKNTPLKKDGSKWDIAVLPFYRKQEILLEKHLSRISTKVIGSRYFELGDKIRIKLCTVDSFQGQESDIVFLSLANSRPTTFINNLNRINVAITRARYQCVIVGNSLTMSKTTDPLKALAKLASHKRTK